MNSQSRILIVDDSKIDQMIIKDILNGYDQVSAYDGEEALKMLSEGLDIDMMILDLNMPKIDGFEVLKALRNDFSHLEFSTIILTNYEEIENEIKGLELGAVDYVRKPLNSDSLLKRIEVHLSLINAKKEIKKYSLELERKVKLRTEQLVSTRDITINAAIGLLEVRDIESSNHSIRTKLMMRVFAEHLSTKEKYAQTFKPSYIEILYKTAPLHDIGKVGVKDEILLKPGKLTTEEFEIMKDHVKFGVNALTKEYTHYKQDEFIDSAVNLIGGHHEKFDGAGYPKGLKGNDIPIEGRLMAIIDVYDAITSKRVYKDAFSHQYAIDVLMKEKGAHFDPYLVDAFIEIEKDIMEISLRYSQGHTQ